MSAEAPSFSPESVPQLQPQESPGLYGPEAQTTFYDGDRVDATDVSSLVPPSAEVVDHEVSEVMGVFDQELAGVLDQGTTTELSQANGSEKVKTARIRNLGRTALGFAVEKKNSAATRLAAAEGTGFVMDAVGTAIGVPVPVLEVAGGVVDSAFQRSGKSQEQTAQAPEASREDKVKRVAKKAGLMAVNVATAIGAIKYGPDLLDSVHGGLSTGAMGLPLTIGLKVGAVKGVNRGIDRVSQQLSTT